METVDERIKREEEFLNLAIPTIEPSQVIGKTFGTEVFTEVSDFFNKNDNVKKIFGEIKDLCTQTMKKNPRTDLTHGPLHSKKVALYGGSIVKKSFENNGTEFGILEDEAMERIMIAGVLHDVGRDCYVPSVEKYFGVESRKFPGHAKRSAFYANITLHRYGFPEDENNSICQAITDHPYTKSRFEKLERFLPKRVSVGGLLSKSLMDADGIDREANQSSYIIYRALINGGYEGPEIKHGTCSHRGDFRRRRWQTNQGKLLFETVLTFHKDTNLYDMTDSVLDYFHVIPEDLADEFMDRFIKYAGSDSWNDYSLFQ